MTKRGYAFIVLLLCSILFVTGYVLQGRGRPYGNTLSLAGQAGMGASIALILLLPRKRKR